MKNTAGDLQNSIMAQIERLSDESLTQEDLEKEIKRSQAIASLSKTAIANARLVYDARKLALQAQNNGNDLSPEDMPPMLTSPKPQPLKT